MKQRFFSVIVGLTLITAAPVNADYETINPQQDGRIEISNDNKDLPWDRLFTLLGQSEFSNASISPTGEYLAAMHKSEGPRSLFLLDSTTNQPIQRLQFDEDENIEIYRGFWVNDTVYAYSVMTGVNDETRPYDTGDIFLFDIESGTNERIWRWTGNYEDNIRGTGELVRGAINLLSRLPDDPDNVLVSVTPYEKRDFSIRSDIYRLNLNSGDMKKVVTGPAIGAMYMANRTGSTIVAQARKPDFSFEMYYRNSDERWQPIDIDVPESFDLQGVSDDGRFVYGFKQNGDSPSADRDLISYELATGGVEVLDSFGFVSSLELYFDSEGRPSFVTYVADKPEIKVLNNSRLSAVVSGFMRSFEGLSVVPTSATRDRSKIVLHVSGPQFTGEYFIWSKDGGARALFSSNSAIDDMGLKSFEAVNYEASDGERLQGWLLPPATEESRGLVVFIHGGPHGPYIPYSYDRRIQMLSQLGFHVFAPNFRGSGGFGYNFEQAGHRQWGTRMLDDMKEGAEYVINHYDTGDIVVALGGSYGGYASAQSLVRYADFYDCSVVIAGVFDLEQQLETWDAGSMYGTAGYESTAIGDDEAFLKANSPIHNLDAIVDPMLIIHGTVDRRTPYEGAISMIEALEAAGESPEYYFYENEGHGLYFPTNQKQQWLQINSFLNRCAQ